MFNSNSPLRWIFRICSIAFIGGMLLGLTHLDSYNNESPKPEETVEIVETEVPLWESNWEPLDDTRAAIALSAYDHKESCEFYKDYPEKSYQIYVDLGSLGTKAQHNEFFNTHC